MINKLLRRLKWEICKQEPFKTWGDMSQVKKWLKHGKRGPTPHLVKQSNLLYIARNFGAKILVETGTCRADMPVALKQHFDHIYSIELSNELFEYSRNRCQTLQNITILHGDSSNELPRICEKLKGGVLFWLDGHYSGGNTAHGDQVSPIINELICINSFRTITPFIVIDDARLFKDGTGYPTISTIYNIFETFHQPMGFFVHDDAIFAVPKDLVKNQGLRILNRWYSKHLRQVA